MLENSLVRADILESPWCTTSAASPGSPPVDLYYLENFPESNIIIGTEKNRTVGDKIYNTIFIYRYFYVLLIEYLKTVILNT